MNKKVHKQTVYENAMDSIDRAIDLVTYGYEMEKVSILKQSIIMLNHGIELLLKNRLMEIHPSLAWEKVDSYPKLDSRTIGLDKAIDRLINIGGLKISQDMIKTFKDLKEIRNAIEHFSWSINQNKAEKLFAKSLLMADFFSAEYIGFTFFGYRDYREGRIEELFENNPFIKNVYKKNQNTLKQLGTKSVFLCRHCRAIIDEEFVRCRKCGEDNRKWDDFNDVDIPF